MTVLTHVSKAQRDEAAATAYGPGIRPARGLTGQIVPVAAILMLGIGLRLIMWTGIIHFDSLVYAHLARRLVDGVSPLAAPIVGRWGALRVGLFGPAAVLYLLFGASDATTLAWPFFCSVAGILGAYGVGRLADGEAAGLTAALLWAVLPTNVASASALLGDGPIAALSILVVFFLLLAERRQGVSRAGALGAALGCFALGVLNKPLILILCPFLAIYFLQRPIKTTHKWLASLAVSLAGMGAYLYYLGPEQMYRGGAGYPGVIRSLANTATDWWSRIVMGQSELSWIAPLWIVATATLLTVRRGRASVCLIWLASTFLYAELGTESLFAYVPFPVPTDTIARHFLLVAAPATIVTGIYLAGGLSTRAARWTAAATSVVVGAVAWYGDRGAIHVTWAALGLRPEDLPFANISAIATAVVVFGGIASPSFITGAPSKWKRAACAVLILAVGLGALAPGYRAAVENRPAWVLTLPPTVAFLQKQKPLPIFVQHEVAGSYLDYASGFRFGFNSSLRTAGPNARIRVAPDAAAAITEGYVVVDQYYLNPDVVPQWGTAPAYFRAVPAQWLEVARFGSGLTLVRVFRVLRPDEMPLLMTARAAVAASRTPQTLRQLLAVAAAAGSYCEAAAAWRGVRELGPRLVDGFDPVQILTDCYATDPRVAGPNLFRNADFAHGRDGWSVHPESVTKVTVDKGTDGVPTWHAQYNGGNWQVIYQEQTLKPDTPYIYEATVRAGAPFIALYWQAETGRHFAEVGATPEWQPMRYVFVTPHWDGKPRTAGFNPVLISVPGDVWIRRLRLSELQIPAR